MIKKKFKGSMFNNSFYKFEGRLATDLIKAFLKQQGFNLEGRLVDLGCGQKPYQEFFPCLKEYIGVDINSTSDIRAKAENLPLPNDSVEVVLCNQLIEHVSDPSLVFSEAAQILIPKGMLILSAPQTARIYGEPSDYFSFTKWGLKYLLNQAGFKIISIENHGGIWRMLGSHLNFL